MITAPRSGNAASGAKISTEEWGAGDREWISKREAEEKIQWFKQVIARTYGGNVAWRAERTSKHRLQQPGQASSPSLKSVLVRIHSSSVSMVRLEKDHPS